jgi:putative ABC transport system substrate-binding protein
VLSNDAADTGIGRQQREFLYDSLQRAGYKVGKTVDVEWRFGEGKSERLVALTRELIGLKVALIIVPASQVATLEARKATTSTPIVMQNFVGNPVALGLVRSLARPAGNVTGTTYASIVNVIPKQYELLKEAAPGATRVASISQPYPAFQKIGVEIAEHVKTLGIEITDFPVKRPDDVPSVLKTIAAFKPDALWVSTTPAIRIRLADVVAFATQRKLVTMSAGLIGVREGLLLYYGPDIRYAWDRTVSYVDRILRGASAGDLPVEQPARYELIFNAKAGRAIGYALPGTLKARVDRVLE